ncbi:MAG: hypothetical protein AB3X44_13555 [Leptothrix sp. (in: b-proteobacteria)]
MKSTTLISIAVFLIPSMATAEYKDDWNSKNFYEAVNLCRSAIIYPAANDYEKKGLERGQTKEQLRSEIIATTPVFESIASDACYCALNEYAKDLKNVDYIRNWNSIGEYLQTPRCKAKMIESMKIFQNREQLLLLRLK